MNCPKCQTPIPDDTDICPYCATELRIADKAPAPRKSRMAKTAHWLAWLGYAGPVVGFLLATVGSDFMIGLGLFLGLVTCVLATVLGFMLGLVALVRIVASKGRLTGLNHAISAVVVSAVMLCIGCYGGLVFRDADTRSRISRTASDMRSLATALEAYRTDHATFHMTLPQLTTPVAYITALPGNGHDPEGGLGPVTYHPFNARTEDGTTDCDACVILNPGPDKKQDVFPARDLPPGQYLTYDEAVARLLPKTYDATNGTYSAGDILRISVGSGSGEKVSGKPGSAGALTGMSDDSTTSSARR